MEDWKAIGQIFVENGIITPKTLARILEISTERNKRLGWFLERLKLVTSDELTSALAYQFNLRKVSNLTGHTFPEETLLKVPAEVALQNLFFPLELNNGSLLLAVADPTDRKIVDNMAANIGLKITLCVASREDIYKAICKFYLHEEMEIQVRNTVLIVDDEETSRVSAYESLIRAGYDVLTANDGMEAFKIVISKKPHVIVTDKIMPKLDGFAFLNSIKAIPDLQSIPVLLMSDKLTPREEMRVFDTGFFDFIPKPINMITLVSRVKRAFSLYDRKFSFM